MARGRAATAGGHPGDAVGAFADALRVRPFDAEAWADRGYAELLAGVDPLVSLQVARSLTKKPALLSAIWFNEATAYARVGKPEDARIRFAIAASLGNRVAESKLAGQSRCTCTWTTRLDAIPLVRGWKAVLGAMPPAVCGEARKEAAATDAEARREACRACSGGADSPLDPGGHCEGPGPWTFSNGHMHCHDFVVTIQSLGADRFVVAPGTPAVGGESDFVPFERVAGGGFARTTLAPPAFDASVTQVMHAFDGERYVTTSRAGADGACPIDMESEDGVELDGQMGCGWDAAVAPVRGPEVMEYWEDGGTGRFAVTAWNGRPTVTFAGKTAHVAGAGCDATVALER
jgi:hypothetical protein